MHYRSMTTHDLPGILNTVWVQVEGTKDDGDRVFITGWMKEFDLPDNHSYPESCVMEDGFTGEKTTLFDFQVVSE